jgi:hypothetical protein
MRVNLLLEGVVDEAVGQRLLQLYGHEIGVTFGRKGWTYIEKKVRDFDRACSVQSLLTLVDFMDTGLACPPEVVRTWLPQSAFSHVFRVVLNEIESWILADRCAIAKFLSIPISKVPLSPESLNDPKQTLINLARSSRSKSTRDALVPKQGHAVAEGPLYSSEIVRFVLEEWNPEAARLNADSLAKCISRLNELHGYKNGEA